MGQGTAEVGAGAWSWWNTAERQERRTVVVAAAESFAADLFSRGCQPAGGPDIVRLLRRSASPSTIDHFIPESLCPSLGVFWQNLFPCCSLCNSTYKRVQWSEELLRPDTPDVERYFDFDPESGEMRPAPELTTAEERRRAEVTIRILGLNQGQRPSSRRRRWQELSKMAWGERGQFSLAEIQENVRTGPYRQVAERLLAAKLMEEADE
jgi:uncharacterized protein (TIGR02646 family)